MSWAFHVRGSECCQEEVLIDTEHFGITIHLKSTISSRSSNFWKSCYGTLVPISSPIISNNYFKIWLCHFSTVSKNSCLFHTGEKKRLDTTSTLICSYHFFLLPSHYSPALFLVKANPWDILSTLSAHAVPEALLRYPLHLLALVHPPQEWRLRKGVNPGSILFLSLSLFRQERTDMFHIIFLHSILNTDASDPFKLEVWSYHFSAPNLPIHSYFI